MPRSKELGRTEAVIIACKRCGSHVAGIRSTFDYGNDRPVTITSGFYDTLDGSICEPCMWDDEDYQSTYGSRAPEAPEIVKARRQREAAQLQDQRDRIAAARAKWLKDHPNER